MGDYNKGPMTGKEAEGEGIKHEGSQQTEKDQDELCVCTHFPKQTTLFCVANMCFIKEGIRDRKQEWG